MSCPSAESFETFTPTDPAESSDNTAKMAVSMSASAPVLTVESAPVAAPADAGASKVSGPPSTMY